LTDQEVKRVRAQWKQEKLSKAERQKRGLQLSRPLFEWVRERYGPMDANATDSMIDQLLDEKLAAEDAGRGRDAAKLENQLVGLHEYLSIVDELPKEWFEEGAPAAGKAAPAEEGIRWYRDHEFVRDLKGNTLVYPRGSSKDLGTFKTQAEAKAAVDRALGAPAEETPKRPKKLTPQEEGKRRYDERRAKFEGEAAKTPFELLQQIRDDLKADETKRIDDVWLDRTSLAGPPPQPGYGGGPGPE